MKVILLVLFFLAHFACRAQYALNNASLKLVPVALPVTYAEYAFKANSAKKLYQRNSGAIIGLQKGRSTAIELGGEFHWRKMSVFNKPHIIGATANMEYNFSEHIVGYKAGMWWKRGRVNLTYGGNISYYNDFKGADRFGFGPSIGFRLMGFHLVNGYTFLTKGNSSTEKETPLPVNTLYTSLRYYFPVENKFTWDRKTRKKKRERKKERAMKKEERQNGERGLKKLLHLGPANQQKERKKEPEEGEKKGCGNFYT